MKKEKRRPSLEELQQMPRIGLELELAYIAERAREAGSQIETDAAALIASETLEAKDIIRLREELQPVANATQPAPVTAQGGNR